MAALPDSQNVVRNSSESRFEIVIDQHLARLDYALEGSTIVFTHTEVPPELEGRGLGSKLAQAGLGFAQAQGYKVHPLCGFISSYIQRHPEYQELLSR